MDLVFDREELRWVSETETSMKREIGGETWNCLECIVQVCILNTTTKSENTTSCQCNNLVEYISAWYGRVASRHCDLFSRMVSYERDTSHHHNW